MKEKELLEKILKVNKLMLFLLLAILIVLSIGVSKMFSNNSNTNIETSESEYNTDYDVSMFKEIEASDLKKETKGKLSVVYIGRETCGWCAAFLPNLWQAQEDYDFTTLYIDIAKIIDFSTGDILKQSDFDTLANLTGDEYDGYMEKNLGSTPMILIVKDNKIVGAHTGYCEYDTFETVLNAAGIK